jgi:hypothetical protein
MSLLDDLFVGQAVTSLFDEGKNLVEFAGDIISGKNVAKSAERYAEKALETVPVIGQIKRAYVDIVDRGKNVVDTVNKFGREIANDPFLNVLHNRSQEIIDHDFGGNEGLGLAFARAVTGGNQQPPTTGQPPGGVTGDPQEGLDTGMTIPASREGLDPVPSGPGQVSQSSGPSGAGVGVPSTETIQRIISSDPDESLVDNRKSIRRARLNERVRQFQEETDQFLATRGSDSLRPTPPPGARRTGPGSDPRISRLAQQAARIGMPPPFPPPFARR